jgi:hypothetical protein
LESEVERHLRIIVEQAGGRCEKFIPDFARGFPDRIVLLPHGVLVWVETKRPVGGVLDGAQNVAHEILRRLGQKVYVVWSKEDADNLLRQLLQETKNRTSR